MAGMRMPPCEPDASLHDLSERAESMRPRTRTSDEHPLLSRAPRTHLTYDVPRAAIRKGQARAQLHRGREPTPAATDSPASGWTRTRYGGTGDRAPVEAVSLRGVGYGSCAPGMAARVLTFFGLNASGPAPQPGPGSCRMTATTNAWSTGLTASVTACPAAQRPGQETAVVCCRPARAARAAHAARGGRRGCAGCRRGVEAVSAVLSSGRAVRPRALARRRHHRRLQEGRPVHDPPRPPPLLRSHRIR